MFSACLTGDLHGQDKGSRMDHLKVGIATDRGHSSQSVAKCQFERLALRSDDGVWSHVNWGENALLGGTKCGSCRGPGRQGRCEVGLIRLWKSENMLSEVVEDHLTAVNRTSHDKRQGQKKVSIKRSICARQRTTSFVTYLTGASLGTSTSRNNLSTPYSTAYPIPPNVMTAVSQALNPASAAMYFAAFA